jgi:hypothetical protein
MCKALARTTDLTHMATLKSIEDLQQVYQLPSVWLDHVTTYDLGSVHSGDFSSKVQSLRRQLGKPLLVAKAIGRANADAAAPAERPCDRYQEGATNAQGIDSTSYVCCQHFLFWVRGRMTENVRKK